MKGKTMEKNISLEEYQDFTLSTWVGSDSQIESELRAVLGISEKAGEVAGKVKKWLRGDYDDNPKAFRADIQAELGDLLWYVALLHNIYDMTIEETMIGNVEKLLDRQARGKIKGSGDER